MVQLPMPPMYFDGKDANSWLVIDGLQRLCTLKEFLLDKTLILSDMEYLADYNGCTFDDLPRIYQRRVEEAQIAFPWYSACLISCGSNFNPGVLILLNRLYFTFSGVSGNIK